jgi:hypothetical protein
MFAQIRSALAAKLATPSINHVYPYPPDQLVGPVAAVIGNVRWTTNPGYREVSTYTYPVELYVLRSSSDDRCTSLAEQAVEELQQALSQGITLGGTVAQAVLVEGDATYWAEVNNQDWLRVALTVRVEVRLTRAYTA